MTSPREELIGLLAERAVALAPPDELINRALRRCVRHDLRAKNRASTRTHVKATGDGRPAADITPSSGAELTAPPEEQVNPALEPIAEGDEDDGPPAPIDTAVAKAHTVAEDHPETHPPAPAPVSADGSDGALKAVSRPPQAGEGSGRQARILPAGTMLGGYRIESLIGVGGMGQVYRATQVSMGRHVALKVLLARYTRNPRFRERFLREARATGRLHHPNLIAVHDVGEADGLLFFSMELVEGTSIKQLIGELGVIAEDRALDIARQALEALRYAHERGIIHRDIKPDNLMLTATGTVKVADLGLSRSDNDDGDGDQFTTQTGTMMGTPYYMPPEQGRDAHRADLRADLYAVGATLYHMVCGKVPFDGDSAVAILIAASTQPLSFPDPGPTPALRRFLEKLMAKKPLDRPQSASDALAMIRTLHNGPFTVEPPPQPTPSGRVPAPRPLSRGRRRRRMRRAGVSLGVIVALAVVGAGAWWEWAHGPGRDLAKGVAELEAGHRYPAALGQIDLAAEQRPRDADLHARLRAQVIADWDAWAATQAAPMFTDFDAMLAANRFSDADAMLNKVQEPWRSPAVLEQLDRREHALEDARNRLQPLEERRQVMQRLAEAWTKQLFANKGQIRDGVVVLTGSGSVTLNQPVGRNRPTGLPVQLSISAPAGERVAVVLASGVELRFTDAGATLSRNGADTVIAKPGDGGRTAVILHRRNDAIEVTAADAAPGSGVRVPVTAAPVLEWKLATGRQAELVLEVPASFMRKLFERENR